MDLSALSAVERCGCFLMDDISVVWLWWALCVWVVDWEDWCIPLALICCSIAVIPSLFLLDIFMLSILGILLSLGPILSSTC